jgi:Mrp family chromosome partitioning ATPase/uncharacterized protein involved in exopolysaccharide biosynthesis
MADDGVEVRQVSLVGNPIRDNNGRPGRPESMSRVAAAFSKVAIAFRHHRPFVIIVTVVATAFTMVAFRQPAQYRATAVLRLVGDRHPAGVNGVATESVQSFVQAAALVPRVRSRAIVGEVVDSLGLQLHPVPTWSPLWPAGDPRLLLRDVRVDPAAAPDTLVLRFSATDMIVYHAADSKRYRYNTAIQVGAATFTVLSPPTVSEVTVAIVPRDLVIDDVLDHLDIVPVTRTDVLNVRYVDTYPKRAKSVANQLVRTFYAFTVNSSQEEARRRRIFLERQLQQTEQQVARAQTGLIGFRTQRRLATSTDKLTRQQSELVGLRNELEADRRVFSGILSRLNGAGDSAQSEELSTFAYAPEIAADPVAGKAFQEYLTYRARLDSITSGGSPTPLASPQVQELREMVRSRQVQVGLALRARLSSIDTRLAAFGDLESSNAGEVATLPVLEAEESRLDQKVGALSGFATQLRLETQQALMSEELAGADVEIVDLATLPYLSIGVPWWMKMTLALVLGFLTGLAIAVVFETRNRSIRLPEELERILQVRGLGVIPPVAEAMGTEEMLTLGDPPGGASRVAGALPQGLVAGSSLVPSVGAEAFRLLYSSLTLGWGSRSRTILVTSVAPREGKTLVAANLALTFGRQGARVLLIDCDLRRPRLHKVFHVPRAPGLADLLRPVHTQVAEDTQETEGEKSPARAYSMYPTVARSDGDGVDVPAKVASLETVSGSRWQVAMTAPARQDRPASFRYVRETSLEGVSLLPCGAVGLHAADTLKASTLRLLLHELSANFDVIILDTPPAMVSADAVILAPVVDEVLMVVRAGKTDRTAAVVARQQIADAGGNVVGAVLNDPEGQVGRDQALYYSYTYPLSAE